MEREDRLWQLLHNYIHDNLNNMKNGKRKKRRENKRKTN